MVAQPTYPSWHGGPIPPGMVAPLSLSFPHLPIRSSAVVPLSLSFSPLLRSPFYRSRCAALLRSPLSSLDALLCFARLSASPPSLLSAQLYSHCRPLPDRAGDGRIEWEMAASSRPTTEPTRRWWNRAGQHQNPRGDGGIKGTSACA
jgi:hypothetical protein